MEHGRRTCLSNHCHGKQLLIIMVFLISFISDCNREQ